MADISQGNRAELIMNPGDVYRVSTGGVATVEAVYGAPAGTTTVTASSQDFGPYGANAKLIVRAVTGSCGYTLRSDRDPVFYQSGQLVTQGGDVVGIADTEFGRDLMKYGFVNSDSADNSSALNAAISAAANRGTYEVVIPSSIRNINCANPITIDISKTSLNLNGASLNFRDLGASNNAIVLTNSLNLTVSHRRMFLPIRNGAIWRRDVSGNSLRDDSYNNSIGGIYMDSASTNLPVAGLAFRDLYVEGFRDGIYVGRSCYLLSLFHVHLDRNYTGIGSRNVTAGTFADQGERIALSHCLLANNYEHIHVEGIYVFVSETSFDYPSVPSTSIPTIGNRKQRLFTVAKGSKLQLQNCHIEFRDNHTTSNDTALVYLQDTNSEFMMRDGSLVCALQKYDGTAVSNGSDGYIAYDNLQNFVEVGGTGVGRFEMKNVQTYGSAIFRSRKLLRLRDVSSSTPAVTRVDLDVNPAASFTNGRSLIPVLADASVTNGRNFGHLLYPTFASAISEDWWFLVGTGNAALSGQTNRTTATSFTATVASSTLSFNKLSGAAAGTVGRLRLLIPAEVGRSLALNFTAAGSAGSSAIKFSLAYVTIPQITNNYIPDTKVVKAVCNSAGANNMTVTTGDTEFNLHNFTAQNGSWDAGDRVCPPYATHIQITFDLASIDASAGTYTLNLKKFSVAFV